MKILVISDRDMSETDSGGQRTVMMVNNYLASQPGIEIYTTYRHLSPVDSRIIEVPPSRITVDSISELIRKYDIDIFLALYGIQYARLARQAVAGTRCKVVTEFHSLPGYEMKELNGILAVHWRFGNFKWRLFTAIKYALYPLYRAYYRRKRRPLYQDSYLLADRLVVLAPVYIEGYKRAYHLPDSGKMIAIGNALSFEREITPQEFFRKEKTVLVVSRLSEPGKRISLAIRVWARLEKKYPDWKLQIVGDGENRKDYVRLVEKSGLRRVSFEGRQDPELYYTKSSVFLMTSAFEGWGMTLTEALQKGCVPVAMDSFGALRDIITDGRDGFIVPDGDLDLFTRRVEQLMDNPEKRTKMAWNGVESSRRFKMENVGPKWVEFFESLLKDK